MRSIEKKRQYGKKHYRELKENGLCVMCGKPNPDAPMARCPGCREKIRECVKKCHEKKMNGETHGHKSVTAAYLYKYVSERRRKLDEKGLCEICGKRERTEGRKTCEECRRKDREKRRKQKAQSEKKSRTEIPDFTLEENTMDICLNCTKADCDGYCQEIARVRGKKSRAKREPEYMDCLICGAKNGM